MLNPYVSIEWNGTRCANRCRHCYFSAGESRITSVRYERAREVAAKFCEWARQFDEPGKHIGFAVGESCELESEVLLDSIAFRRDQGMPGWDYLNMNGLKFRSRAELVALYSTIRDAGVRLINLSWHGCGDSHDAYAGRRGDFDHLLLSAEVIAELGLGRSDTVLLRKPIIENIPALMRILDSIPGRGQLVPNIIDYLGRGEKVEHERIEFEDLDKLPEALVKGINLVQYRTEASWIEAIARGTAPDAGWSTVFVAVNEDSVGYLEHEDCETLVQTIMERDEARRAQEPPTEELARDYGAPESQKLYRMRDLRRKWSARYWATREPAERDEPHPLRDSWVRVN